MLDRRLALGNVIAGKYRIESVLGEGGMGIVLGARNIRLDEPVAIKVLKPDAASDQEAVARFFREARAAVRMKGVHVAKVLDVGALEDGTPYMLMELLEGADLSTVIERGGTLSVQTAVDYLLQTCEALAEAHALGIVHRDIKPSNLFLTTGVDGSPCVKVLDFGISKATNAIDATRPDFGLTQTQTVMGSPQYMAPEQMRSSRRVDGRTDIWALGTIMHELLVGAPPFVASTMPELFAMILQDPAPRLRERRGDVPPAVDDVVLRCLEKSPDARPASVLELAHHLAPFGSALSAGAAERIARVGKNIAGASERMIAAIERARESSPNFDVSGRGAAGAPVAPGSAPSAPALAHANTTRMGAPELSPGSARGDRTKLVAIVASVAAVLIAGATIAAFVFVRARNRATIPEESVVSATATTAAMDLPPSVIDPPPPATGTEPPIASSAPSAAGPGTGVRTGAGTGPAASSPSVSVTKHPGPRAPAGSASSGSAPPSPPALQSAAPVRPATTASSRYD